MPAIEVYRSSTYHNRVSSALTLTACFVCTAWLFLFLGKLSIFRNTDSVIYLFSWYGPYGSMQCDSHLDGILFLTVSRHTTNKQRMPHIWDATCPSVYCRNCAENLSGFPALAYVSLCNRVLFMYKRTNIHSEGMQTHINKEKGYIICMWPVKGRCTVDSPLEWWRMARGLMDG